MELGDKGQAQAQPVAGDASAGYVSLSIALDCVLSLPARAVTSKAQLLALGPDRLLLSIHEANLLTETAAVLSLNLGRPPLYELHGTLKPAGKDLAGTSNELASHVLCTPDTAAMRDILHRVRKNQHIHICASQDVEASDRYTGFADVILRPSALPELAWSELDTSTHFLGRRFAAPVLITGMTGGVERGAEINLRLARAAAHHGLPMGVGSQRLALENPEHAAIFSVKKHVPGVFLIGNLGFAQLCSLPRAQAIEDCRRAVEMIEADALAIHVNAAQEIIQPEGDRDFRHAYAMIEAVRHALPCPLIIKEVGSGMDTSTVTRLAALGVAAIDIGGRGGTSWTYIEGARARAVSTQNLASSFRDWGIPTAVALLLARQILGRSTPSAQSQLIATGGIRDGHTVAKAVGLGADMVGLGLPLFRAALASDDGASLLLDEILLGLKTAMLCSGARTLRELSHKTSYFAKIRDLLSAYGGEGQTYG